MKMRLSHLGRYLTRSLVALFDLKITAKPSAFPQYKSKQPPQPGTK